MNKETINKLAEEIADRANKCADAAEHDARCFLPILARYIPDVPDEPRKHGVIYATVRDAINSDDEEELHIECRFANGGKYAPIVIDAGHDELAHAIAEFLSAPKTAEPSDETPLRKVARELLRLYDLSLLPDFDGHEVEGQFSAQMEIARQILDMQPVVQEKK